MKQRGVYKMAKYTKKEIMELVEQEDVEFIRLQFTCLLYTSDAADD